MSISPINTLEASETNFEVVQASSPPELEALIAAELTRLAALFPNGNFIMVAPYGGGAGSQYGVVIVTSILDEGQAPIASVSVEVTEGATEPSALKSQLDRTKTGRPNDLLYSVDSIEGGAGGQMCSLVVYVTPPPP